MNKKDFEKRTGYKLGSASNDWESIISIDAEGLYKWIEQYAEEMCEKQKEICADVYHKTTGILVLGSKTYNNILNAPLATKKLPGFNEVLGIFKDKK